MSDPMGAMAVIITRPNPLANGPHFASIKRLNVDVMFALPGQTYEEIEQTGHALVEMGVEVHEVRDDAEDRDLYIESPVEDKSLCLHAKVLLLDHDRAFVGSANLDPRSLRINTEMGLMIESPSLNAELRSALEPDFSLRNAWHVRLDEDGGMVWVSDSAVLDHQPEPSFMRRIEDWFLSLLPLEEEL